MRASLRPVSAYLCFSKSISLLTLRGGSVPWWSRFRLRRVRDARSTHGVRILRPALLPYYNPLWSRLGAAFGVVFAGSEGKYQFHRIRQRTGGSPVGHMTKGHDFSTLLYWFYYHVNSLRFKATQTHSYCVFELCSYFFVSSDILNVGC